MVKTVLTAQQRANQKQNAERANMPRISPFYISADEAAMLDVLAAIYGSKKAAILAGLRHLQALQNNSENK